MTVLVGSTVPQYLAHPRTSLAWLNTADAMRELSDVRFFAALETDGRADWRDPFTPLTDRLDALGGSWWRFLIDTNDTEITTRNRIMRICAGRNLVIDRALAQPDVTHVLFLDADLQVTADSVGRLLALDWPIVGGHIPSYCLDGPRAEWCVDTREGGDGYRYRVIRADGSVRLSRGSFPKPLDLRQHWTSAGFLLVARDLLRGVRWGYDMEAEQSDDVWFAERQCRRLGYPTIVDHSLIGTHVPLVPLEARGLDRTWRRE